MLKGILSISGEPGLFKLVSQAKSGIIVESIETKKRMAATATNKISSLQDIAIFTDDEEVLLKEVFKKIKEKSAQSEVVTHKSDDKAIKSFFKEVLPNYDVNRVYISDMKKVFRWYNILAAHDLLNEPTESETQNEAIND